MRKIQEETQYMWTVANVAYAQVFEKGLTFPHKIHLNVKLHMQHFREIIQVGPFVNKIVFLGAEWRGSQLVSSTMGVTDEWHYEATFMLFIANFLYSFHFSAPVYYILTTPLAMNLTSVRSVSMFSKQDTSF